MVGMGRRWLPCSKNSGTLGIDRQRTWLETLEDGSMLEADLDDLQLISRYYCTSEVNG
jgi:hypothetical protein